MLKLLFLIAPAQFIGQRKHKYKHIKNKDMGTRIFKFLDFNGGNDTISFIDSSDIETTFNSYGMWIKGGDTIDEDYFEENEDGTFSIDEDYVNYDIKNLIDGEWDLNKLTELQKNELLKMSEFQLDESEDADSSEVWEIEFDCEKGFQITESEPYEDGEHYTYWDGSNHKTIILSSNNNETHCEEITDEFQGIEERFIEIGDGRGHNDTRWTQCLYDEETDTLWAYNGTLWQGESPHYEILSEDFLADIRLELEKGEKIEVKDNAFCFSYRNEEYHYSTGQIIEEYHDFKTVYFINFDLNIAREAIRLRRIERVTERFAENNYELVSTLPLDTIFVSFQDSISAGNCVEVSQTVMREIAEKEGFKGEFEYPANKLLEHRDDNYTRRAVLRAYRKHL